jgi:hypothetical protein
MAIYVAHFGQPAAVTETPPLKAAQLRLSASCAFSAWHTDANAQVLVRVRGKVVGRTGV